MNFDRLNPRCLGPEKGFHCMMTMDVAKQREKQEDAAREEGKVVTEGALICTRGPSKDLRYLSADGIKCNARMKPPEINEPDIQDMPEAQEGVLGIITDLQGFAGRLASKVVPWR